MASERPSRRWPGHWLAGLALLALMLSAAAGAAPPQRYSYFSPGLGTVNLENLLLEPDRFKPQGRALPGDLIVLTGISQRLLRLRPDGKLRWVLDVSGGRGSYGLGAYRGRILVAFDHDVLVVNRDTGRVESRLPVLDEGFGSMNFLRVQGDRLLAGESSERSRIVHARLSVTPDGQIGLHDRTLVQTRAQFPRDALFLDADTLAIADTFGHAVVLMTQRARWRETRRMAEYFPNMLGLSPKGLEVLSEHGNRLTRWDLATNQRQTLIACPHPLFEDASTRAEQIVAEEGDTITAEQPPRQLCSVDVSGPQTLYAANGFYSDGAGATWIADADNHRVALFVNGVFWGAVGGINHPVRLLPVGVL